MNQSVYFVYSETDSDVDFLVYYSSDFLWAVLETRDEFKKKLLYKKDEKIGWYCDTGFSSFIWLEIENKVKDLFYVNQ